MRWINMKKLLASLIVSATVAATLPLTSAFAAPETVGQPQIYGSL